MRSFVLFAAMSLVACSGDSFDVGSTPGDASTADTSTKDTSVADTSAPKDTSTPVDTSTTPDTATTPDTTPTVDTAVPVDTAGQCVTAADCKKYSSYCADDPCRCIPLKSTDPNPKCTSGTVTCIIDPCTGKSADCVAGVCVVK